MKLRPMTEAPNQGQILILTELGGGLLCWISAAPTEDGGWLICATDRRLIPACYSGWVVVSDLGAHLQRVTVFGWIPAPEVTL